MRVLLTGASGFVGSHVLRHLMTVTDWEVVAPITFRHKGLPERIESAICTNPEWVKRVTIVHHDLLAPVNRITLEAFGEIDVIMNVASESHVDRSIEEPGPFIRNNVDLMINVLEYARVAKPWLVLQMSTDEVYGPAYGDHRHAEWESIIPSNPYSASKAAQEAIATSYWRTYDVPVVITNTMNIIGEMQDKEKFIPKVIASLRDGERIPVHCAPDGTPGSRFYLHARNLADAWVFLVNHFEQEPLEERTMDGKVIELPFGPALYSRGAQRLDRFHIVGEREIDNVEMVHMIAEFMGTEAKIDKVSFHSSRPGHDLRYALDGRKIEHYGWRPPVVLGDSLYKTVQWTLEHPEWLL